MKLFIFTLICLLGLESLAQTDLKPPLRQDCHISPKAITVKYDTLFFYRPMFDSPPIFDTLIFNEVDSNRLILWVSELEGISMLLKNGMLNATILKGIGCPSETYSHLLVETRGAIVNKDKTIDLWNKECIFLGFEGEVEKMRKPLVRVFKIAVSSATRSSTSIFYLEITNLSGKLNMKTKDFIEGAYVSCIAKWYAVY